MDACLSRQWINQREVLQIDGLAQDCGISIAKTLELLQSCA